MMNVIALQKDNELFICNHARAFIESFNKENLGKGILLFPNFPLWAFAEDSLCGKKFDLLFKSRSVKKAFIGKASFIKRGQSLPTEFFFPLFITADLENESIQFEFKIVFAKSQKPLPEDFTLPKDLVASEKFPVRIKSFRTGNALTENNAWSLFDEKWTRCSE
ncbi:MAG: hypothetical protein J5817_02680 [Treponema sp.]|nr:hypothetical protein [Treponema sp.]